MRSVLALLVLTLALAGPAGAQQSRITAGQPAAGLALRGTLSADAPATQGQTVPLAPILFLPQPVAGAAGQCRLSCARSYYFCLSADGGDDCAPSWSQCRARCEAPRAVQAVAGAFGG